ncbi:MAG: ATP-binding protein [Eubacteriales bacterium]|nr:ATP-binding protein [Eubacteriales bacterium]
MADTIRQITYFVCRVKDMMIICWKRSQEYYIFQNLTPYIRTLQEMRIAKYINFAGNYHMNKDIEVFQFEIYGISDDYKKDMGVLGQLLTLKLRDFYVWKLKDFMPVIYLTHLHEGEFVFWISRNKYGDELLYKCMETDRGRERPNIVEKQCDIQDNKQLILGIDMEMLEKFRIEMPITIDIWKKPSGLIVGASGSGKSYFVTLFVHHILNVCKRGSVKIYYCDFKSSEDTAYLAPYCRYFAGEKCAEGLTAYYEEYKAIRDGVRDGKLRLIFFDEWAGFQLWETQKSKKQAELYKGMLQEILLMGRSLLCGAWVILQRPDSTWISGRENFHNICCFLSGGVSTELGRMILLEEEISEKVKQKDFFRTGEAIFKSDGEKTRFMKVGEIPDIETYKRQILDKLLRADGEAGSTEPETPLL